MSRSPVPCPHQNRYYSETFHIIDKENGIKENYDLGGKIQAHNWCPKLCMRLFKIILNDAYQIYDTLVE